MLLKSPSLYLHVLFHVMRCVQTCSDIALSLRVMAFRAMSLCPVPQI